MKKQFETAVVTGNADVVRGLLDSGVHINALDRYGQTALMKAAHAGHLEVVRILVERGADLNHTAKYRMSALMLAVIGDHPEIVELLVRAGADIALSSTSISFPQINGTALDIAQNMHHLRCAEILLTVQTQKSMELPFFRFHPDPLRSEVIERSSRVCPVCQKITGFSYIGPFYSVENVKDICPWCIANGNAAQKYDGEFQDPESIESPVSDNSLDEILHRTPNYFAWQQQQWLVHCGEPCAFIANVGWAELELMSEELTEDIHRITSDFGLSVEELKSLLSSNGSLTGYLFKCIHCTRHRLTVDAD
jgi:uncharacterized protein CbrC (UPF0167 family)